MMHSHAVGLWMRDRPVSETSTCRKHNTRNKHTSMSPGWIRTLHPSKWAAAELCLTQRSHKDRKSAIMKSRIETKYTAFCQQFNFTALCGAISVSGQQQAHDEGTGPHHFHQSNISACQMHTKHNNLITAVLFSKVRLTTQIPSLIWTTALE